MSSTSQSKNMPTALSFKITPEHLELFDKQFKTLTVKNIKQTVIPDILYERMMEKAITTKPSKFKEHILSKRGEKTRVRFKAGLLYENNGTLIIPTAIIMKRSQEGEIKFTSFLGLLTTVGSSPEFQKEFPSINIEELKQYAFDKEVRDNATGNHYRNHFVKAKNPYGHD